MGWGLEPIDMHSEPIGARKRPTGSCSQSSFWFHHSVSFQATTIETEQQQRQQRASAAPGQLLPHFNLHSPSLAPPSSLPPPSRRNLLSLKQFFLIMFSTFLQTAEKFCKNFRMSQKKLITEY